MNRVSSKRLAMWLQWGAQLADLPMASILNACLREFNIRILIPWMRWRLKVEAVFPRQSVLSQREYNLFYSDLDIGIIIDEKTDLKKLRSSYRWMQRWIPYLGEVEIYTRSEHKELQALLDSEAEGYQVFRDIRKIRWMDQAYAEAAFGYHKDKALRSIQKCRARLKLNAEPLPKEGSFVRDLGSFLDSYFLNRWPKEMHLARTLGKELQGSIDCPYFGKNVIFYPLSEQGDDMQVLPQKGELVVSSAVAVMMFSLTPPTKRGEPRLDQAIEELRKQPSVFNVYWNLSRIEFLIFQAVIRGFECPELWQRNLLNLLQETVERK